MPNRSKYWGMQIALDEDGGLGPPCELGNVIGIVGLGGGEGERLPEADEIERILDDVMTEAVEREHPFLELAVERHVADGLIEVKVP